MSATCSRVSWVDLCNEDEANAEKWLQPSSNSVVLNNAGAATPAPTPSKQLGECLNNLHMITPSKDTVVKEPIVGPIKFYLEDKLNDLESSEIPKPTDEKGENTPENITVIITDNKQVSLDNEKSRIEAPVNCNKDCLIFEPNTQSDVCELPLLMESKSKKSEDEQSFAPKASNINRFDDSRKRSRRNSASSSATTSDSPRSKKANYELELDPAVLKRRQKQIDFGKNTLGYDSYIKAVPKDKRKKNHPTTPPKHLKYSRRAFDGLVKIWRQELHNWDPKNENEDKHIDSDSESDEPSLDESLLLTD